MTIDQNWNMLGHEWAVNLLRGHLANRRFRHAYLITGPQGVGRRTLALRLAQALNCISPVEPGLPCGICRACRLIEKMEHPDLTIVQAAEIGGSLKVDQIREVQPHLALAPYEANYRIALFLRFEEANQNAANALLKTLEEPPSRVVMLLTAQDPESLLPTINSRCELIRLRPLTLEKTQKGLETKYELLGDEAKLLAHVSGGRPGYALGLHQNPDRLDSRQNWLREHFELLSANRVQRFSYAENLSNNKATLSEILQVWTSFWRDVMLVGGTSSASLTNPDWETEIKIVANKINITESQKMLNCIERAQSLLNHFVNPRLTLEVLMLDLPKV